MQSLVLLAAGLLVLFVSHTEKHGNPLNAASEILKTCAFDPPGAYRPGPYPYSVHWCDTLASRKALVNLKNHMLVHLNGSHVSFGAEYGSNIRLGYLADVDRFMLNPEVKEDGGETMHCEFADNTNSEMLPVFFVSQNIQVSYLDIHNGFLKVTERFGPKHACDVKAMASAMG